MKRFILVSLVLALAGCMATTTKPQGYRPAGYNGPAWQISASAEDKAFTELVTLMIDGKPVTSAEVGLVGTATGYGEHQGHKVRMECEAKQNKAGIVTPECEVFVDNERATIIAF